MKAYFHTKTFPQMFIAALFVNANTGTGSAVHFTGKWVTVV
jgi:hypothetical protein